MQKLRLLAPASALALVLAASPASAQPAPTTDAGQRGSLVFDDISGFRASTLGGIGYAGPIGVSFQSLNEAVVGGANGDSTTYHYTNFWFAPSVDVFVIDHLSVGGLVELAVTSASVDQNTAANNTTVSTSLPTTLDVTVLPRVGWLFDVNRRFAIWPRVGLGWAERQNSATNINNTNATDTFSAFIFEADCGFLYRVTPDWFLRAAPDLTIGPGSHSLGNGNTQTSANATLVSFAVTGGFGFMWNR
jgi:hypothetical protein